MNKRWIGRMPTPRTILALVAATVATAVVATIVQTQVNLAAIVTLGAVVPIDVRVRMTIEDIARFGPVMAAIAGAALIPALSIGNVVARRVRTVPRATMLAGAGVAGLWTAFFVMGFVTPMPALVAAVRGPVGLWLVCATGIVGGLVFARLTRGADRPASRRIIATAAVLVAVPLASFLIMKPEAAAPVPRVDPDSYQVETVIAHLDHPWSVAFLPDGRRLVTEMGGRLRVVDAAGRAGEIALTGLPPILHRGGGLMEVVVDPDFARNATIYLTMTYGQPRANGTRLVRARLAGDRIADVRILFDSTPKTSDSNNGGRVAVLRDGTLLLTLGDANDLREEAQNVANSFGTLVRIDRDGRVPRDNPFVSRAGAMAAVYSLGHRNVQGVAVDPVDGSLLISDHGPRGGDEINRISPGSNHGWPVVTGGIDYSFARVTPYRALVGYDAPLVEWTPSIAPAGLAIYDGELFAGWRGHLLVPALVERAIRLVIRRNGRIVGQRLLLAERNERMRDVKVAPDGSIYALTDGADAALLRLTPRASVELSKGPGTARSDNG